MKYLLTIWLVMMMSVVCRAANPTFSSFDNSQFGTSTTSVSIKSSASITNFNGQGAGTNSGNLVVNGFQSVNNSGHGNTMQWTGLAGASATFDQFMNLVTTGNVNATTFTGSGSGLAGVFQLASVNTATGQSNIFTNGSGSPIYVYLSTNIGAAPAFAAVLPANTNPVPNNGWVMLQMPDGYLNDNPYHATETEIATVANGRLAFIVGANNLHKSKTQYGQANQGLQGPAAPFMFNGDKYPTSLGDPFGYSTLLEFSVPYFGYLGTVGPAAQQGALSGWNVRSADTNGGTALDWIPAILNENALVTQTRGKPITSTYSNGMTIYGALLVDPNATTNSPSTINPGINFLAQGHSQFFDNTDAGVTAASLDINGQFINIGKGSSTGGQNSTISFLDRTGTTYARYNAFVYWTTLNSGFGGQTSPNFPIDNTGVIHSDFFYGATNLVTTGNFGSLNVTNLSTLNGGLNTTTTNTYTMTATGFTNTGTKDIQVMDITGTSITYSNANSKLTKSFGTLTTPSTIILKTNCSLVGTGMAASAMEDL